MERKELSILKRRKVRLRGLSQPVQGHTAGKWTGLVECSFLGRKGPWRSSGEVQFIPGAGAASEPEKSQCVSAGVCTLAQADAGAALNWGAGLHR